MNGMIAKISAISRSSRRFLKGMKDSEASMKKNVFAHLAAAIIEQTNDGIISKALDGTITTWNAGAEALFGYTANEAIGQPIEILIPQDRIEEERRVLEIIGRGERVEAFDTVRLRKGGSRINVSVAISPIQDADGKVIGASKIARDITVQKQAEARLKYYEAMVRFSNDAIISSTLDGVITSWNPAAERLFGYTEVEVIGQSLSLIVPAELLAAELQILTRLSRGENSSHHETVRVHKDGRRIDISSTISPILDQFGHVVAASNIARDIALRKLEEAIVTDMAYHDPLTNLANRRLLMDRIRRIMLSEQRTRRHGALLYIDLDNFKHVNDRAGHDIGDLLLIAVAKRIAGIVRENDTVSRLGGDEFAVLLDGLNEEPQAARHEAQLVANKVIDCLRPAYQIRDAIFDCAPSIGVALFRGKDLPVEEILKRSDQAMYQAKLSGKNRIWFDGL